MQTKSIAIILFSFFLFSIVYSQDVPEKARVKKNSFSIEFYQPIDNLVKPFYNVESLFGTDFILDNYNSRNSFLSAIGFSYERIQNDIVFRPRLGISIINSKDHYDNINYNNSEDYKSIINQNNHYTQKHINLFIGIAKRTHFNQRFSIDCGLDLASIFYLKGSGDYDYYVQQVKISDNTPISNQLITVNDKIGQTASFGIGPIIKPQYTISKSIQVSMELQVYFMGTFSKGTTSRVETSNVYTFANNSTDYSEVKGSVYYSINQWNWTKISPLLRIGYEF